MVLRSVGVLSVGKISGAIGVFIGLIFGFFFAMLSAAGVALKQGNGAPIPAMFAGIGVLIIAPLFYGIFMFIMGIIYAAIYNLLAGFVGGIEMDFERRLPISPTN
jgi:hypothetical protein